MNKNSLTERMVSLNWAKLPREYFDSMNQKPCIKVHILDTVLPYRKLL